ncbi:PapD-like protein [Chlamydoabsidia padenii]|nr:PapD-like protein [Chlamydoabsidia padenii]
MSLTIEPSDLLTFKRPLTHVTKEILLVSNPHPEPVIFKVKTTAPKQYCVRPNAGRIEGNGQVEVQVILQPFNAEPPLDFKCKDKFLVQSAKIDSHGYDSTPVTDLWSRIETQDKGAIHQHKIKCSFNSVSTQDMPTIAHAPSYTESESSTKVNISSMTNSDHDTFGSTNLPDQKKQTQMDDNTTTKEQSTGIDTATEEPRFEVAVPQHSQATNEPPTHHEPIAQPSSLPTNQSGSSPLTVSPKEEEEGRKLRLELAEAQRLITRLQQELTQNKQALDGLRLRQNTTTKDSTRKLPPTVQPLDAVHQHLAQLQKPHPVEGYPPQVVAIICGVVFIFTYLFF